MRASLLLLLFAGFAVGCSSTNSYDRGRTDRPDVRYDRSERPGSAARPWVCHNGNTIAVPRNTVRSHRRHGDRLGQCTQRDRREARRDQRDRRNDSRAERRDDRRDRRDRRADRREDRHDDRYESRRRDRRQDD